MSTRELASALVLTVVVASIAGCRDARREPPSTLVDSSPARTVPVELEGIEVPVVETRAMTVRRLPCGNDLRAGGPGIERIGVMGSSVTVASMSDRVVRACDSTRPGEWCGRAFKHVRSERSPDARLSLTCTDDGRPIGFGWIEHAVETAYVVVAHEGYAEAYRVAGDVPVRVSSERVDLGTSSARFAVSEHDEAGRRLREYVLESQVAD